MFSNQGNFTPYDKTLVQVELTQFLRLIQFLPRFFPKIYTVDVKYTLFLQFKGKVLSP